CAASAIEASSRWPADESQSKDYYAKNDAVINERPQSAATQIMQKPPDDKAPGDRAHRNSHNERRGQQGMNAAPVLMHIPKRLAGRRGDRRCRKQKRKS